MTKTLTLLRHAKAVEGSVSGDDHDRGLTERGFEAAEAVGRTSMPPRLVLCSSARRTMETFNAAAVTWDPKPKLQVEKALYLASAQMLLKSVQMIDDAIPDVWLIGHNPGLHELARRLAVKSRSGYNFPELAYRFPTASRAIFVSDALSWDSFADSSLTLLDFRRP